MRLPSLSLGDGSGAVPVRDPGRASFACQPPSRSCRIGQRNANQRTGTLSDITSEGLPRPPAELLEGASLFLDIDGTLLDIVDRPEDVVADAALQQLLGRLLSALDGRLAVVSGRSLAQVDAILGEIAGEIAVSGSHGCEHRWRGISAHPDRPPALDRAAERFGDFIGGRDGVLLEEKSFGVALHYRMNPAVENEAQAIAVQLAGELGLDVQHGKMMVELRVPGGGKGKALQRLMRRAPMAGTRPVFIGDDVTDEDGFAAARALGGHGILIGDPRGTAADYRLDGPAQLRGWLAGALQ